MAYDKQKAHEYYINYRKKGLLKGRKKGKGKQTGKGKGKGKGTALTGVSMSGLTDDGKLQAELIKNSVGKEMNAALAKAKTDEDKIRIKHEYSIKAKQQIEELKKDPKYGVQKASKGGGSSKGSSGSGKSSGGSKASGGGSSSKASTSTKATKTTQATQKTAADIEAQKALSKSIDDLYNVLSNLPNKLAKMTDKQRTQAKTLIADIISELKKKGGLNTSNLEKQYKDKGLI